MKLSKVLFTLSLILMGCGKEVAPSAVFDSTSCPTGMYDAKVDTIDFVGDGSLTMQTQFCTSSGSYSCSKSSKSLTLTISSVQTGTLASGCQGVGTYQCSYTYDNGWNRLLITCAGSSSDNKLNPTKTYETFRLSP